MKTTGEKKRKRKKNGRKSGRVFTLPLSFLINLAIFWHPYILLFLWGYSSEEVVVGKRFMIVVPKAIRQKPNFKKRRKVLMRVGEGIESNGTRFLEDEITLRHYFTSSPLINS